MTPCKYIVLMVVVMLAACQASEVQLRPIPQGATIVAFGDSLTYGTGATAESSYPSVLSTLVPYNVINAGVPGEETKESLARIPAIMEQYHPALVIICLGGNDLIRKRPNEVIKQNLEKMIRYIKANQAQVILIAVPRVSLSLSVPDFYEQLGKELNVVVVSDALPNLLGNNEYKSDYIHLNANGYKKLAEQIARIISRGQVSS